MRASDSARERERESENARCVRVRKNCRENVQNNCECERNERGKALRENELPTALTLNTYDTCYALSISLYYISIVNRIYDVYCA